MDNLNNQILPQEARNIFKAKDIPLPENIFVKKIKKDVFWKIKSDKEDLYLIDKIGGKINFYFKTIYGRYAIADSNYRPQTNNMTLEYQNYSHPPIKEPSQKKSSKTKTYCN